MRRREVTQFDARSMIASRFSIHLPPENHGTLIQWGQRFLSHYFQQPPSVMHRWIADKLDTNLLKRGTKIAVVGPRGGAKSTLASLTYPLKQAIEGREPSILIISDTADQALEHLRAIKSELEWNEELEETYPNAFGEGPIWRENFIQLRNGCVIRAYGTGSKIRGRRQRQHRPTLIILDDPENDQHTISQLRRERTRSWFRRTLINMGDDNTNFLVLGTAIHRDCLVVGLHRTPGWLTRRIGTTPSPFKAIEKWPANMDLWAQWGSIYLDIDKPDYATTAEKFYRKNKRAMDAGAELLWPERESLYSLMTKRAEIGDQAFESEKQSNPINPETCEWPEEYFDHEKMYFDEWPKNLEIRVMSLDPSKGKSDKRGDYSAIAKIGIDSRGVVYAEVNMARRPTDKVVSDSLEEYRRFRPSAMAVETNQYQELLVEDMQTEAQARDININIHPLVNTVNKRVRIRRMSPLLASRRIRFKANHEGTNKCVQQLREFPNADYDDGPDALEMACRIGFAALEADVPVDDLGDTLEVDYG